MVVSVIAIILKTGLGYLLIFGIGGLPALGVRGAAIGYNLWLDISVHSDYNPGLQVENSSGSQSHYFLPI